MSDNEKDLLFELYKLYAELAERVSALREGLNKLYSGMVAGIVAASVVLHRLVPDTETIWVIPTLGNPCFARVDFLAAFGDGSTDCKTQRSSGLGSKVAV